MKQGDIVKIWVAIDACRTGLKKQEYRVKIGDKLIWVPAEFLEKADED